MKFRSHLRLHHCAAFASLDQEQYSDSIDANDDKDGVLVVDDVTIFGSEKCRVRCGFKCSKHKAANLELGADRHDADTDFWDTARDALSNMALKGGRTLGERNRPPLGDKLFR